MVSARARRLLAAALLVALACARSGQERYEEALSRTGPAARHAVHAARLAELMRGLERLTDDRLPQALDVAAAREQRAEAIREVALGVASSARGIPDAVGDLETQLDPPSQAAFVALSEELGARASALAEDVPGPSETSLEGRVAELHAVCDACHERFRVPR